MRTRLSLLAAGVAALAYAAQPLAVSAAPVTLSAETTQSTAKVGNSSVNSFNRAGIVLLALGAAGTGVANLAATAGNGTGIINLPAGWNLETTFVPPGGCSLRATALQNAGNGRYIISLISASNAGPCPWGAGDYLFTLRIQGVNGFDGGLAGKLTLK